MDLCIETMTTEPELLFEPSAGQSQESKHTRICQKRKCTLHGKKLQDLLGQWPNGAIGGCINRNLSAEQNKRPECTGSTCPGAHPKKIWNLT